MASTQNNQLELDLLSSKQDNRQLLLLLNSTHDETPIHLRRFKILKLHALSRFSETPCPFWRLAFLFQSNRSLTFQITFELTISGQRGWSLPCYPFPCSLYASTTAAGLRETELGSVEVLLFAGRAKARCWLLLVLALLLIQRCRDILCKR